MSFLTRLLLVILLSGPCTPQSQEEVILLTLKSIAAKQESFHQKSDVLEDKLLAQDEQLENLTLSVGSCSSKHQMSIFLDFLATGDECERNTNNCSIYATCRDLPILFECSCMAGYSGNGVICEDIDECKDDSNVCRDDEICINLPGTYTCICHQGYEEQGDICQDIDECNDDRNDCGDGEDCINLPGNYTCICLDGYEKQGDICQDLDECKGDSNVCEDDEVCINIPGNYSCTCQDGYVKQGGICQDCTSPSLALEPFGCIIYVEEDMTWSDAQAKCNADGGSLLYGFNNEQLRAIGQHFYQHFGWGGYVWIGVQGGVFVTSPSDDGLPETTSSIDRNVGSGGKLGDNTKCGWLDMISPYNPRLRHYYCSQPRSFLCQIF